MQHLWVRPLGKHHYTNCTSWNKNVVWQISTDTEPKFGPLLDPKWHRKIPGVSVRPMDWFQVGKGVHQGCILSSCLFNFYAEYIIRNARLDEAQAGIKISRRNINNLRYADDTHPYGRKRRGTEEPLDESERGKFKSWLKTQHSDT